MLKCKCVWLFVALLFVPSAASAQESGDVGVFMGYPSLGFVWHVSEKVAIRPEVSFSSTSTEFESSLSGTGTAHTWNVKVAPAVLLPQRRRSTADVCGAAVHLHALRRGEQQHPERFPSNTYGFAGFFGARYSLNDRFSIFGELGVGYTHVTTRDLIRTANSADNWGTRTGVGVILYF